MIGLLRQYMLTLAQDATDVAAVVAQVGSMIRDPGVPMPIAIAPIAPVFATAALARDPESGLPFMLRLEPLPDRRPTLAALVAAFGPAVPALTHRGRPPVGVIARAEAGSAWAVALIATLSHNGSPDDRTFATTIELRRDRLGVIAGAPGAMANGGTP